DPTAGFGNADDASAAAQLSRVLRKADFECMDAVGQFNLSFVIARRRSDVPVQDDLFIVDQHAADEKYNFETLQQKTRFASQRLPEWLELSAADELVAIENAEVLKQNGFEIEVHPDGGEGGRRVRLVGWPEHKGTTFEHRDLEELIHLLRDCPAGTMVRCSRVRAMFAMRACRMSIMVGHALSKQNMTAVVRHMASMDQPWHCPHGRPTMRHLVDISGLRRVSRKVDWKAFG
ncbi:MutL C terminal dimerization domain-containing protein, partial [Vararia minispora EC-137]